MVVLKRFNKGERHPPNSAGNYVVTEEQDKGKRLEAETAQGLLASHRTMFKTKEAWLSRYCAEHGHVLTNNAWLYLWEDDENEFGPVCP